MAGGGSAEDSEPLFVLEPLPELSNVMDSFLQANPLISLAAMGFTIYLLVYFKDPFVKITTALLANMAYNYYATESLFYSALFSSLFVLIFFMIMAAIHWDTVQLALGINKTRILSWASFIGFTWILVILGKGIGMPTGSGIVVCAVTTAYLWWTYYSLEPATN